MAQINHSESDEMSAHEAGIEPFKAEGQGPELIDPSKAVFAGKTMVINVFIKKANRTGFGRVTIARILLDIGNQAMVEASFACVLGIKGRIGIEESASNRQLALLYKLTGLWRFSVNTRVTTDDGRPIMTPVIQEFASVQ